jgi:hypothetical protein
VFSDGMSLACGWRWPTGALPINRVSCVSDGSAVGLAGLADDLALPMVCAIAAGPSSRVSNATVVIKLRVGPPEIACRYSRRRLISDLVPE